MDKYNFTAPELYFNRELSLLEFNRRVLQQASDSCIPLLERLKFLCISSANLDEFFEIRVAGLKQLIAYGTLQTSADGLTPTAILKKLTEVTRTLVADQHKIFIEDLIPALAKHHVCFVPRAQWSTQQADWLKQYFQEAIVPVVSPIALDPAHPMPRLVNKSLNFIVSLQGKDAFGRETNLAIVHIPRALPRIVALPQHLTKKNKSFVWLTTIVTAYIAELFPGLSVKGCYQFRLTRNSDLLFEEEVADDLVGALQNKLLTRPYGMAVRLEVADECPPAIIDFLLHKHSLSTQELYAVNGPVNLSRLSSLYDLINEPKLKYPVFKPTFPPELKQANNLFAALQKKDILLHHPYQSFEPILEFIRQATLDAEVLAIKQTLYRTGPNSLIVRALMEAARAGKEVTAVIELRARFEEASNIDLANRLQEAGVLVVYGVLGFKTHAKMLLIIRREGQQLRRYCHLGTGNYHADTARLYTDYGLLTSDKEISLDVQNVFQQLTGMGKVVKLKKLWQAPFTLIEGLLEHIKQEALWASQQKTAHIVAKMNALTDSKLIQSLYMAAQAGVKIDLIVRGICCLRPGIPGVSTNITVRSVVGRFLEHERVFYFYNNGDERLYCASADWMERNLYKRVEVCFPIQDKQLMERIKEESFWSYLDDKCSSWILQSDGSYIENTAYLRDAYDVQERLLKQLAS